MRSLLLGTVSFSEHCLETLVATGWPPVAVACMGPRISNFHTDHVDLVGAANSHGIPGYHVGEGEVSLEELIKDVRPDVVLVFGWPRIINAHQLEKVPLGFVGTHPALLPRNRGRHPIVWSLVDGESKGGLTFFKIDEGVDSGPILWQESFPIDEKDHAGDVYEKMQSLATRAIPELMQALAGGAARGRLQDNEQATYRRKRVEKDGEIDWHGSVVTAYNLIRALARPYAGAHTYFDGKMIKLWRAEPPSSEAGINGFSPGAIIDVIGSSVFVAMNDGVLQITEHELPTGLASKDGHRLG